MQVTVPLSVKYALVGPSGMALPDVSPEAKILQLINNEGFPPNAVVVLHDGSFTPPFFRGGESVRHGERAIAFRREATIRLNDSIEIQFLDDRFVLTPSNTDIQVGPILHCEAKVAVNIGWLEAEEGGLVLKEELSSADEEEIVKYLGHAFRKLGFYTSTSVLLTRISIGGNYNAAHVLGETTSGLQIILFLQPNASVEVFEFDDDESPFGWPVFLPGQFGSSEFRLPAVNGQNPSNLRDPELRMKLASGGS